jgi:hypothetical protein
MVSEVKVNQCRCEQCQLSGDNPEKIMHRKMNLLLSRLDESQRRWYAAVESARLGHGGDKKLSEITGLDEKTNRRGREEINESLASRPVERVRIAGGGRPLAEKKSRF